MISKEKIIRKITGIILASTAVFFLCTTDSFADTADWRLRYIQGAPSSEYKGSWSKMDKTTKTTTKAVVNKVGGGAEIFVYSSTGISSLFSGSGSTKADKVAIGQDVYLSVNYTSYGTATNYPDGYFSY